MKGRIDIRVSNSRASFRFTLNRNITVVRGDSGTGKTTLYEMIAEHTRLGKASGVEIAAPCPCVALTDMDWQNQLGHTRGSVVFIDEGADYLASRGFASAIQKTDNYYVIFNRENLHELPYSVEEIYEIRTSSRYHTLKKIYQRREGYVYSQARTQQKARADVLVTEDSHAGYQFYQRLYEGTAVRCETAKSNSGVYTWLQDHPEQNVFVMADGAAFGSEMDRVMKLEKQRAGRITVCLPESFEWLILKSGLIPIKGVEKMLEDPGEQIESSEFFSWERFFEDYLIRGSAGTYYAYSKGRLLPFYAVRENLNRIIESVAEHMPETAHE